MGRRVKDFIEISDYTSLDSLINALVAVRDNLPPDSEPELKLRGDDHFGRRLTICYLRELTTEEAECDARYTGGVVEPNPDMQNRSARRVSRLIVTRFNPANDRSAA